MEQAKRLFVPPRSSPRVHVGRGDAPQSFRQVGVT